MLQARLAPPSGAGVAANDSNETEVSIVKSPEVETDRGTARSIR